MPEEDIDIGELTATEAEPEAAPKKRGRKAAEPVEAEQPKPEGPKLVKVRIKNGREPRLEEGVAGFADDTIVEVPQEVADKWFAMKPPAAEKVG